MRDIVGVVALCGGMFILGSGIGLGVGTSLNRDMFLSYCTAHGDSFEVCKEIWNRGGRS